MPSTDTPDVQAWITLDDVKTQLEKTSSADDAELQGYIDAACDVITKRVGPVEATTYTEIRDGGTPIILLNYPPVVSITSITEYIGRSAYALTLQPLGSTVNGYGYSLDEPQNGAVTRRSASGTPIPFAWGYRNVIITYQSGYAIVPPALRLAAMLVVQKIWESAKLLDNRGPMAATPEVMPPPFILPDNVLELIEPYIKQGMA